MRVPIFPSLCVVSLLFACEAPPAPGPPGPCAIAAAEAPGPLSAERSKNIEKPAIVAELFLQEGLKTGDSGFYTLAAAAAACALERDPTDLDAAWLAANARYQQHRFAEAEAEALVLTTKRQDPLDWMLLGDARMEQGRLESAADAYQSAVNLRPGPDLYGRISYLRWLWGDAVGAEEMAVLAVASSGDDAVVHSFHLGWLGWLHALAGQEAPEIDAALAADPTSRQALLYQARVRLARGDGAGARASLAQAPTTFESLRIGAELDPAVDLAAHCELDHRACAVVLAETDPARAAALINREWAGRQDAHTMAARAWIGSRGGADTSADARAALATGSLDPEVLLLAGLVLRDPVALKRALAAGPGLLPSQRRRAEEALAALQAKSTDE